MPDQLGIVYLEPVAQGNLGWPADTITDGPPDIENITEALQGPYGKCVFESPNDVVDHQVRIGRSGQTVTNVYRL